MDEKEIVKLAIYGIQSKIQHECEFMAEGSVSIKNCLKLLTLIEKYKELELRRINIED